MKQLSVCLLLLAMIGLCGCPVLTKNSVDDGSYEVPSWLPGKWCEVTRDGTKKDCNILKKEDKKGTMTRYETDASGNADPLKATPVILSNVGSKIFMFAYTEGDGGEYPGYYIFELRKVSNTEFVLAGIKEHAIDYEASRDDIKKYLLDNKNNNAIFDPAETTTYKKQ